MCTDPRLLDLHLSVLDDAFAERSHSSLLENLHLYDKMMTSSELELCSRTLFRRYFNGLGCLFCCLGSILTLKHLDRRDNARIQHVL